MFDDLPAGLSGNPVFDRLIADRAPSPFADDFLDVPTRDVAANITPAQALHIVVQAAQQDRLFALKLIECLGGFDAVVKMKPRKAPMPMPFDDVLAIEVTIGDAEKHGPLPKTKRTRPFRERLRYTATVQVWQKGAKSFTRDRAFKGHADLRDPDRAFHDANEKANPRKGSFSREYADWICNEVVPLCNQADLLVGFLLTTQPGAGDQFHDGQVILMPRSVLRGETHQNAMLLSMGGEAITLPGFEAADYKGADLAGTFALQSRGVAGRFAPFTGYERWATGKLEL